MSNLDAAVFHNAASSGDFRFINHNPVDYEAFRKHQETVTARFQAYEEKRSKQERASNLEKWDDQLADRWRGAKLTRINNPAAQQALAIMAKSGPGSFFLQGDSGVGKTYIAYAMIRRYIGVGWVTPSQIQILSEDRLLGYAYTGFEGRKKLEQTLSDPYTLYLVDGVGGKSHYEKKELQQLEQLVDHIYSNSLMAFFTSNHSARKFSSHLSDSGASRFRHLVDGKILEVNSTREPVTLPVSSADLAEYHAADDERTKLDAFKG